MRNFCVDNFCFRKQLLYFFTLWFSNAKFFLIYVWLYCVITVRFFINKAARFFLVHFLDLLTQKMEILQCTILYNTIKCFKTASTFLIQNIFYRCLFMDVVLTIFEIVRGFRQSSFVLLYAHQKNITMRI